MNSPSGLVRTHARGSADLAEDLARLWPLLGRHNANHPRLVDLTASVKAALLLSQSIYWTRHGRDIAASGGWFFKTSEQWERETGLSACEQAGARRILRGLALLDERRIGIPGRLHYRLALDPLGAWLAERIGSTSRAIDWNDDAALAELLGPALAYHRILAAVAGGAHAGLLLSRGLYLTRHGVTRRGQGWFRRSTGQWTRELGLSRRELDAARGLLTRAGLWEEALSGIPPVRRIRIRLEALLAVLNDHALPGEEPASSMTSGAATECGNRSDSPIADDASRLWQSHNPVSIKPPKLIPQKRQISFEKTAKLREESTQEGLLQPQHEPPAQCELHPPGGGDLILPEQLLPEERQPALDLVARCPGEAQALLDELAARLETGAIRTSPIAYLRGMVRRAQDGTFIPELGVRIAAARRAREEAARQREREALEARQRAEARTDPEYPTRMARRIEALRRAMAGASPTQPPTQTE